jgi:hypothetical protein
MMKKEKLFDKVHGIKFNPEELKNSVAIKLPDETAKFLKSKSFSFPYKYFERILRMHKIKPLEENLFKKWKQCLPIAIHKDCPEQLEIENKDSEKHCFQSWMEFNALYILSGNEFAYMIESNKRLLRNITKERLAILFFQKAFVFENANSFFQVGEMSRLLIKEGLKNVSEELKKLETKRAIEISNENLNRIKKETIFNDNGFEDVEELQKMFWESEKENYLTKLQLAESFENTFIDYFIRCINTLQREGERLQCIANIRSGVKLEQPFRDIFKVMLSPIYKSVESEPEKGNGRIDLKIHDNNLPTPIIIEFKGWWNNDKKSIVYQLMGYLTDFEEEGYIFMVNHNRKRNILLDYKRIITDSVTGFIQNSWNEEKYKKTGFVYYSSLHNYNDLIKKINHFIYNANY